MNSQTETRQQEEVLYEITLPIIVDDPEPDFSALFDIRIPNTITADYFVKKLKDVPFIQQQVHSRALPNSDFPPLPTVFPSKLQNPQNYRSALPINQRQLSVDECDELCSRETATKQLRFYMKDYWLSYEPYIPKWPVVETEGILIPDDENLPAHASSFRSQFNASVMQSAIAKKQKVLDKQTCNVGIHFQCFNVATIIMVLIDETYAHLLPLAAGWLPGSEIEDQKTASIINAFVRSGNQLAFFLRSARAQCNSFSALLPLIPRGLAPDSVEVGQTASPSIQSPDQRALEHLEPKEEQKEPNAPYQSVSQENGGHQSPVLAYLEEQVKPQLIQQLRRQDSHWFPQPGCVPQTQWEELQRFLQEADRLEKMIEITDTPQFDLLEGEYLITEESRHAAQIASQKTQLMREITYKNEAFSLLGPTQVIPKEKFTAFARRVAANQTSALTGAKRYAPHPQCLPPPSSPEYFYNNRNGQAALEGQCATPTITTPPAIISSQLVPIGGKHELIVSNRTNLPEFIMSRLRFHPLFNRPNIMNPPTCYFRSGSHGFGLFALAPIPPYTVLCEYAGEVIGGLLTELRDEAYQQNGFSSVYMFHVRRDAYIDATFIGNLGRFINHGCEPNSESTLMFKEHNNLVIKFKNGTPGVGVVLRTIRQLNVGQESVQNYNMTKAPFDKKIPCYCGAPGCSGFMN